jgi:YtxH-like protein
MIQDTVRDRLDAVRGLSSEDILAALGLQRKRSTLDAVLPALGVFAAGLAIGTGVALLLAPKSGREMRRELKGKANDLTERIGASAQEIVQEVRSLTHKSEDQDHGAGIPKVLENGTRTDHQPNDGAHRSTAAPK